LIFQKPDEARESVHDPEPTVANLARRVKELEYRFWSSGFWRPFPMGVEQGVSEDDPFSHDRGYGAFCGLSGGDGLALQVRIETGCDEGWHQN
jgi:hypothetical protein